MSGFFVLAWSSWEDYEPHFFTGPEDCSEEQFIDICTKLVPEAGLSSLAKQDKDQFIGWPEVVESMIPLLEMRGFTHVKPKRAVFNGSIIIETSDTGTLGVVGPNIVYHNESINHTMSLDFSEENS